jgi:hypothetical protein
MDDEELEALANEREGSFVRRRRAITDFRYDESQEKYWDVTTGKLLGARSVNGAIPRADWPTVRNADGEEESISPSKAINDVDTGLTVEGSTWWPGKPQIIENLVVTERGAQDIKGASCYNCYIGPRLNISKDLPDPERWIQHVKMIYPEKVEHEHFFDFCAHALQKPHEKINHGIVLAGGHGIGKDTAMIPIREGVGQWNAAEIGPDAVTSAYNGYLQSVLLIINEVRPHDEDYKASNFYNMLKPVLAAPPEMLPVNMKFQNTVYIRNLCHVVLTTNDPLTMYIPAEDRRLFVMTSPIDVNQEDSAFPGGRELYFNKMHSYLREEKGCEEVIAWLLKRDISRFNAAATPPMTKGKEQIINSATQVRRTPVDDILDAYFERNSAEENGLALFHKDLTDFARSSELFDDKEKVVALLNAKNFHFKMAERGYEMLRNPEAAEWRCGKYRSRLAFIKKEVPRAAQIDLVLSTLSRRAERGN